MILVIIQHGIDHVVPISINLFIIFQFQAIAFLKRYLTYLEAKLTTKPMTIEDIVNLLEVYKLERAVIAAFFIIFVI